MQNHEICNIFNAFGIIDENKKAKIEAQYNAFIVSLRENEHFNQVIISLKRWFCASALIKIIKDGAIPSIDNETFNLEKLIELRNTVTEELVKQNRYPFQLSIDEAGISVLSFQREILKCNIDAAGFGGLESDQFERNKEALKNLAIMIKSSLEKYEDNENRSAAYCAAAIRCQISHMFCDGNHRTGMYLYYQLHLTFSNLLPKIEPAVLHGYLTLHKFFEGRHNKENRYSEQYNTLPDFLSSSRLFKDTRTSKLNDGSNQEKIKSAMLISILKKMDMLPKVLADLAKQAQDDNAMRYYEFASGKKTKKPDNSAANKSPGLLAKWRLARRTYDHDHCIEWDQKTVDEIRNFGLTPINEVFVTQNKMYAMNRLRRDGGVAILRNQKGHFELMQVDPKSVNNYLTNPKSFTIKITRVENINDPLWRHAELLTASSLHMESKIFVLKATEPHAVLPSMEDLVSRKLRSKLLPNTIYKLLKLKFERSDNAFKSQALAFCSLIQKYHVKLKELFDFNLDHKGELCLSEKLSNKKGSFVYADIDIFKLLMSKEELHQNLLSKINETRYHSNDNECTAVEDESMLNELYSEFWLMQRSPRI